MKHLSANKVFSCYPLVKIAIIDIKMGDQNCIEAIQSAQPAIFPRQACIFASIGRDGMENPIIIDDDNRMMMGGCRLRYAIEMEYDSIDAIVVNDEEEIKKIQKEFVKSEFKLIPEKYVYKHILDF